MFSSKFHKGADDSGRKAALLDDTTDDHESLLCLSTLQDLLSVKSRLSSLLLRFNFAIKNQFTRRVKHSSTQPASQKDFSKRKLTTSSLLRMLC